VGILDAGRVHIAGFERVFAACSNRLSCGPFEWVVKDEGGVDDSAAKDTAAPGLVVVIADQYGLGV